MADFLVLNLTACDYGTGVGHPPSPSSHSYEPPPQGRPMSPAGKFAMRVINYFITYFLLTIVATYFLRQKDEIASVTDVHITFPACLSFPGHLNCSRHSDGYRYRYRGRCRRCHQDGVRGRDSVSPVVRVWDHAGPCDFNLMLITHLVILSACSDGWWLMTGAGLFWEKSTVGWLMVAGLFWEKSTPDWWLISQTNRAYIWELGSHIKTYLRSVWCWTIC
jgi:hypothetical protein